MPEEMRVNVRVHVHSDGTFGIDIVDSGIVIAEVTPTDARRLAVVLFEASHLAQNDSLMFEFLNSADCFDGGEVGAIGFIRDFRRYCEDRGMSKVQDA